MAFIKKVISKNIVDIEEKEKVIEEKVDNYDETYSIINKILISIGLRITITDTKFASMCWNLYFWFNFVNLSVAMSLEATNMFLMAFVGTLIDLFTMMPCVGYVFVVLTKAYKIKRYDYVFEHLIYELRDMWPNGRIPEEDFNIVNEALNRLRFMIKAYFLCNMTLGSIFNIQPIISWIKLRTGFDVQPVLIFSYWLPYDPFEGYWFDITLLIQVWHCFLSALFMLAGDLLFCIFLSHITTQFDLLSNRINRLVLVPIDDQLIESFPLGVNNILQAANKDNRTDEEKVRSINEELIAIVLRHRSLIRLSGDVESMYTFSILVNFINSSIIICFCLFCCAFVEKWNEYRYKIFFITAVMQIWMLCWYGQKLLDSSSGVAEALYNCGWYLASNKIKKSLLIMIQRSQNPVYVTTYGFSVISLESYAAILKTSWSYFTLLSTMYED